MSVQAAVLRIVIRLLAAAVMFALAMRVSRGTDQIPPTAMTPVPAAGLIRPLVIEHFTSTESTQPTAKQQRPARHLR